MSRSKIEKGLVGLALKAIQIHDSEIIHMSGDVVDGLLGPGPKKNTTSVWIELKKTGVYKDIFTKLYDAKVSEMKPMPKFFENILAWFIYDAVSYITKNDSRPKRKSLHKILKPQINLLLEDIFERSCILSVKGPLFKFQCDTTRVELETVVIRHARFSEQFLFEKRYPRGVTVAGDKKIDWILDMECSPKSVSIQTARENRYHTRAGNLITALRLLCGGGVGIELLDMHNIPFSSKMTLGKLVDYWESTHGVARSIRPSGEITVLHKNQMKSLRYIFSSLEKLDESIHDFIWRAIRRFGQASNTRLLDDKMIDLIICLESLFGGGKDDAMKRAATLTTKNPGYDNQTLELLKLCVKARHALVHGRSLNSAEEECGGNLKSKSLDLTEIARMCILLSVTMIPPDKKDFWDAVDLSSKSETSKKAILASIPSWFGKSIGLE
ncbi:MAG: hypothetical protein ACTSUO_09115 [Candidatus Thorarchaeota archaeon]